MLRKTYDWAMGVAASRHAPTGLFAVSFAESSFFPLPPDVILGPMILARPDRAFVYAGICTAASVLGGLFGYAIGFYLEPVARSILEFTGHPEGQAAFEAWYEQWGVWAVLVAGFTPFPYKLVTIASGMVQFDLFTFIWASVLTRGARFFLTATLLKYFGPAIREQVERRLGIYTSIAVVVLIGLVVALKVLG